MNSSSYKPPIEPVSPIGTSNSKNSALRDRSLSAQLSELQLRYGISESPDNLCHLHLSSPFHLPSVRPGPCVATGSATRVREQRASAEIGSNSCVVETGTVACFVFTVERLGKRDQTPNRIDTRTFQEASINSLLEVKRLPKTTCWKVLVYEIFIIDILYARNISKHNKRRRFHNGH